MKKFIIPFLMLCLGHVSIMIAANTDVSSINNVIYISPFSVSKGTQTTLSIKMKNTAAIRGFQFDLYLPDGVTVVKSAKGRIQGSLTESRLPDEDEHELTFSEQNDGAIRFLCSSQYDETFTGTDGELATLKVNIDNSIANGEYPIFLKNIKLTETDISKFYETALVETSMTVCPAGYILLDETSTNVPAAAASVNVIVKRSISAGNWSTICLPFSMTAEQVKAAFGNDVKLAKFTNWSFNGTVGNVESLTLGFISVTVLEKNHPYLIKVSSNVTEFETNGVTIDPVTTPKTDVDFNASTASMNGIYTAKLTNQYDMFLANNKFWYSNGSTSIMAFRATFNFGAVVLSSYGSNSSARVNIVFDGTSDIKAMNNEKITIGHAVYNLQGQRVDNPTKGLYVKNGKKFVIK